MHRYLTSLLLVAVGISLMAAVPPIISYQGRLEDSGGNPLNGSFSLTFRLYDVESGGSPLWSEVHSTVSVTDGVFVVPLGSTSTITPNHLSHTEVWLGIQVGGDPEMTPRTRLLAVPYAIQVLTIDDAAGGEVQGRLAVGDSHTLGLGNYIYVFGSGHTLDADSSSILGGVENQIDGNLSIIGGGRSHIALGRFNTVGGGYNHYTSSDYATIAGGGDNFATATYAFVGGGDHNQASGMHSVVAGGGGNHATAQYACIGGGVGSIASADYATVAGGQYSAATGQYSFVGGGTYSTASGTRSVVGGGFCDTASGDNSVVSGGFQNRAHALYSTVSGGASNRANGLYSVISGGGNDTALGTASTIAGGSYNKAGGDWTTVGGGSRNYSAGIKAAILGGYGNEISSGAGSAFIGGGDTNYVTASYSAIAGGRQNQTGGTYSFIGAGQDNYTSGMYAAIPAGENCSAQGLHNLLVGRNVTVTNGFTVAFFDATNPGRLVINRDDNDGTVSPSLPIRVGTTTSNGNGAYLSAGGTWTNGSSRTYKENFEPLDGRLVLRRLADLPVEAWNYRNQPERHIGPVAEDFVAAFNVGTVDANGERDNKYLATSDVAGVALLGIKELARENEELKKQIADLLKRLEQLEKR